ncbi:MAG: hypothetical protein FIA97_08475 [Methylococcaceae bacterium]|nr:hypothetical protein [Methylococcaceae bacterium]
MHRIFSANSLFFSLALLLSALVPASVAWGHGGASVDTDQCRIFVGPHLVHFTAYQPQLTGTTEYCNDVPDLGPTILVFDYEGKALRNMTVELEITKEPEGSRVFYMPPAVHPTGTFNTSINFTEPSKYLAHVTLLNEGERVDAHVAFKVGAAKGAISTNTIIVVVVLLVTALYIFYLSNAQFKALVDRLFAKKSASE